MANRPKRPKGADSGRPKGALNKIPLEVKKAMLLAADRVGQENHPDRPLDGLTSYMRDLALHQPLLFLPLLEKVLHTRWVRGEGQMNLR